MSVIVKRDSDGEVFSFVKGADSVMSGRFTIQSRDQGVEATMDEAARRGERVLMFGVKRMGPISEKEVQEKDEEAFEQDLEFLGVTGLEDLL